jgi:hypothetical protein
VLAGTSSKPSLNETRTLIKVEKAVEYKFTEVECERIPSLEFVELKEVEGGYAFAPDTPAGTYRIAVRCFDPGIISKRITVTLGPTPAPEPGPGPKPDDPHPPLPVDGLSALSKSAVSAYLQSMAADMESLAKDVEAGKIKTVIDASTSTNARDLLTRATFKKQMALIMEPRLGSTALPANAPQVFRDIATGFRGAVK